jgi:N utilization substance protein A
MSDITKAIQVLCEEKNLSYESVMEAIEFALAAAYRKDFGNKQQNIKVKFNPETGDMKAWDVKTVVEDIAEDVLLAAQEELTKRRETAKEEKRELTDEETADLPRFNPKTELMISAAKEIDKKVKLGEVMEIPLEIGHDFGRMAAQTAKQVIIQKIREAERGIMFTDFKAQEGQLVMGTIQRAEARKVLVDFGKVTGVLLADQQNPRDHYKPGARMKFLILSVQMSTRGLEVLLSRSDVAMVREIFKQEIPEINDGLIEIKGVAREPGFRSKVSVFTADKSIDPIGSCIGQRGSRINTIIEELGGEKIDIIQYSEDAKEYIAHALAPAKILHVKLSESEKIAEVSVAPDQFSLAIGRNGQNVRLAADLSGWRIDVVEEGGKQEVSSEEVKAENTEKNEDKVVAEEKIEESKS